ncbi:nuclear transport factor 2 family protein [Saccharopolyspora rhizosphaerae]|uniref:Nuclear transport factor 2 family protein n=1 Tax=Saccharopolyspora rhizosphaerae TaxID=2492662 RepID=A0A3R8P3K6_9PSEU|nr:nuclear transport factor 2 family protein [Saccharopolyspora rhizosphaerae]RRO15632.1 nuclear transport factor 2 family protein [Saccharopolyspora rhizosphaerae]
MTQQIQDRFNIEDALIRYTRAIDSGEWDVLDTVFTPDARIDYTASGGIEGDFDTIKPWLAENLPIFPRRMHSLHQIAIDHDGPDRAEVAAYFHNPMVLPRGDGQPDLLVEFGGIYHHSFLRTAEGWRSRRLQEEVCWKRGL